MENILGKLFNWKIWHSKGMESENFHGLKEKIVEIFMRESGIIIKCMVVECIMKRMAANM